MGGGDQKNFLIATILSVAVVLVWQFFFVDPEELGRQQAEQQRAEQAQEQIAPAPTGAAGTAPTLGATPAQARETALEGAVRAPIDTPNLKGSISLKGGRIDDLSLKAYRKTLDPSSPNVTLLSPTGADGAFYAVYGWIPTGGVAAPGPATDWMVESGETLSPDSPLTLVWDNGEGLIFRRVISVDDKFMFSITQSVENTTGAEVSLAPYGIVARHGEPETTRLITIHEGGVAVFDGVLVDDDLGYGDIRDRDVSPTEGVPAETYQAAENGWLGFTDKYWLTAMAPKPGQGFTGVFKASQTTSGEIFQADMRLPVMTVPAGQSASVSTDLFAGAKEWETVRDYEADLNIGGFTEAMNWGTFFFLTKPMFKVLHFLYLNIGNMGWAILALTLIVKTCLFPLAYKSFVSMSRMKKLQPEMEKLKERAGDDKQKLQQEMMALYKKEKVNPASGCVPILLQIPIFFSLYKVISISLELRQAPFVLWIKDLSAPDPTSVLNLFGLLPLDPPEPGSMLAIVSLGVLPIILGVTMWMQQKLNPAPTDPMQQKIFAWMPWIFMFMLGTFASGLVIYWCFNNILTFIQQFIIMRSQGVEVDFFGNVKKSFRRKKPQEGGGAVVKPAVAAKPANDNPGKGKSRRQRKKTKSAAVDASNPGGAEGAAAPAKKPGSDTNDGAADGGSSDGGASGGDSGGGGGGGGD